MMSSRGLWGRLRAWLGRPHRGEARRPGLGVEMARVSRQIEEMSACLEELCREVDKMSARLQDLCREVARLGKWHLERTVQLEDQAGSWEEAMQVLRREGERHREAMAELCREGERCLELVAKRAGNRAQAGTGGNDGRAGGGHRQLDFALTRL